ncbi:MAG: CHAT domain-containing tetratricopeptide repeat protein [Cyclobacteriaceae bacterium]
MRIKKIESFLAQNAERDSINQLYHEAARRIYKNYLEQAITWQNASVDGFRTVNDTANLARTLYNLGHYYKILGEQQLAEQAYAELISYKLKNDLTGKTLTALGKIKRDDGDFYMAEKYFRQANKVLKFDPEATRSYFKNNLEYISLLSIMGDKAEINTVDSLFQTVDSLISQQEINLQDQYDYLSRKSNYYEESGDYPESFNYRKKALEAALELGTSQRIANSYNNLGVTYIKLKDHQSAINTLMKVAEVDDNPYFTGASYNNLGDAYMIAGNDDKALEYYTLSLNTLFNSSSSTKADTVEMLERNPYKYSLMQACMSVIEFYWTQYEHSRDSALLRELMKHVMMADRLLGILRSQSFEDTSKLYWREKAHEVYGRGIRAAYELADVRSYFYFMEKNKAILLLENLTESQAEIIGGMPSEIIKRGRFLKSRSLDQSVDGLDNFRIYKNFLDSVKSSYSKYSGFKRQLNAISLERVRSDVISKDVTDILQYFVDEQSVYSLHISADTVSMRYISPSDKLNQKLKRYQLFCNKPIRSKAILAEFRILAVELYGDLFPAYPFSSDKLLIVADGMLQNIPFESLVLPDESLPMHKAYVVSNYTVSYGYSLSHFVENTSLSRQSEKGYLGVAPGRFYNDGQSELKYSVREVRETAEMISGDVYIDQQAVKAKFLKTMDQYKLIHLSTHANSGLVDSSYIAFKDSKLRVEEIYAEKNDAELIVLSACETSVGEQVAGEGVMSLSRAFFYAGAASVMSTLWNVNDETSVESIIGFYQALLNGESRSQALRTAKINYLNTHSGSEISPYYWSSLILIGDNKTLSLQPASFISTSYLFLIISLIIILILVFLRMSRPKTVIQNTAGNVKAESNLK